MRRASTSRLFSRKAFLRQPLAVAARLRERLEGGDADRVDKDGDDVHGSGLLSEPPLDRAFPHPSNEYNFGLE